MSRVFRWAFLLVASGSCLFAQQGQGVLYGTVTDSSGAPVAGATVKVTQTDTNFMTTLQSGAQGEYVTPAVPVGNYTVAVDQPGFKSVLRTGLVLQVGQRAEVDIVLTVGSVQETVQVQAEVPLVNTSDATVGSVVENKRISELPLNGRNALALMFLTPAVKSQAGATNSGFADRGIALTSVSINGGPSSINNFTLDGGNNNQAFLQDLNVNPTVDAIQEFKVQSGVMPADAGFTLGGVVNIVTKSGTNDFHGTAYEFVRNNAFDARNTFSPKIPAYRYNQYGGAIGGPIWIPKVYKGRDRTFFFFNIEEWQYVLGSTPIASVPTAQQRAGDYSQTRDATGKLIPIYDPATTAPNPNGSGFVRQQFPNNMIPASRFDPAAVRYLQLIPMPNRTPDNAFTNSNNYIAASTQRSNMQQYVAKVNHYFSEKNTAFARYMYFNVFNNNGGGNNIYTNPILAYRYDNLEARNFIIGDTHTFSPTVFNELRLGLARNYFPFINASYGTNAPQQLLGLPASVPPYEIPLINAGLPATSDQSVGVRGQTTWQLVDTVTWNLGTHSIKMGVEGRLQRSNNYQVSALSGSYTFASALTGNPQALAGTGSSFATLLLGAVSSASVNAGLGQAVNGHSWSGFVQDDWRATRRLTLNVGLRYDYQSWPVERYNGISNFLPNAINPLNGLRGAMGYAGKDFGRSPYTGTPLSFGPRFGFAWDVVGNAKTVVRGGYGIYYQNIFYRDFFGATSGFASTTTTYNPPGNNGNFPAFTFSQGLPSPPTQPQGSALGPSAFLGQTVPYTQPSERVPQSQQWDFTIQRQLPANWAFEVGYTGNHTTHLVSGGYDMNQLPTQYLGLGNALQTSIANPYAGIVPGALGASTITLQQLLKPYPYYVGITVTTPTMGNSIYHAGILSVQKRLSNGLVLLGSYTKSKLISDSVSVPINFGPVVQVTNNAFQNGYNRRAERAIDPTNVAQRFVLSGVYELPVGRGKALNIENRFANAVFGGWQTNGILTLQTGLPVVITGANNNLATRPNSTGQSAKLDNPTRQQWFNTQAFVNPPNYTFGNLGRTLPDVSGPGTINLDLSLIKNLHLAERFSLQFRAEAFNVTNHVNLGQPNTQGQNSAVFVPGANGLNSSSTFGTITTAAAARTLQFGAKLNF